MSTSSVARHPGSVGRDRSRDRSRDSRACVRDTSKRTAALGAKPGVFVDGDAFAFLDDATASFSSPRRRRRPRTSIRGCRARRGVVAAVAVTGRIPNNGVDADVAPKGVAFFSVSVAPPPAMLIVNFDSTLAPATAATHRAPRARARLCARRPPFVRLAASARTARTRRRSNRTIHPTPSKRRPGRFRPFRRPLRRRYVLLSRRGTDVNVHSGDTAPHPYARFALHALDQGNGKPSEQGHLRRKIHRARRSSGVKSSSRSPRLVSASSACVPVSHQPRHPFAFARLHPTFPPRIRTRLFTPRHRAHRHFPTPRAMAATRAAKSVFASSARSPETFSRSSNTPSLATRTRARASSPAHRSSLSPRPPSPRRRLGCSRTTVRQQRRTSRTAVNPSSKIHPSPRTPARSRREVSRTIEMGLETSAGGESNPRD